MMIIGYLQQTLGPTLAGLFTIKTSTCQSTSSEIHNIQRHGSHFKHQANTLVATNGAENMPFRAA